MFPIKKFIIVGTVILLLAILFTYFSDPDHIDYDYSGIVHDVHESRSGYTFYFDTADETIRCYHSEEPVDLGYYKIKGNWSDDHTIFFVEYILYLD